MLKLIFALIAVAVAVPAGGLLAGVDRRLTARLQSRQGPPLLQPFYDVLKLFGKAPCVTNPWLIFSSYVCLMASAIALLMFFMQGDMLLLFFVMTVGAVFKVAGALSADSPYSNVGAQRELLQMLAYEPLVILTFVGHVRRHRQLHDLRHLRARRAAAAAPAVPVHRARLRADHQARQVALRHRLLSPRASGNRARRADRLFRPPGSRCSKSPTGSTSSCCSACAPCSGTPASRAWSSCSC